MNKVAVIGAGIIGVCIAHFLRKNGHQVTLYDQNEPGTQTSFGNAGLFASHECVTANSPHLWKNLPSMLLNKDEALVIDWFYVVTHLPWAIRFLRNCTSARAEHIAKSLSSFSSQASLAYEEIFDDVDVSNNIVYKEPIFLYESKELFEKNQYVSIDLQEHTYSKYKVQKGDQKIGPAKPVFKLNDKIVTLENHTAEKTNALYEELVSFINSIKNSQKITVNAYEGKKAIEVALLIKKKIDEKK